MTALLTGRAVRATAISSMLFVACTAAERSDYFSLGAPHDIVCYSGGEKVFSATSTGKIMSHDGGSFSFEDRQARKYVTVTMDCVVTVAGK